MSKTRSKDPNYVRRSGSLQRAMKRARLTLATYPRGGGKYVRTPKGTIIKVKE